MQFRTQSFPWCVVDSEDVGDGTLHPVAVPLDKAAEWYWRVKKWELSVGTVVYGTVTFSDLEFPPTNFGGSTERDLICPTIEGLDRINGDAVQVFWTCWNYSLSLDIVPSVETDPIRRNAGAYYPQFVLDMQLDVPVILPTLSTRPIDGTYAPATIALNLDGYSVALYTNEETGFLSADFYPTEWWPYAPESDAGSPVWDSATGAQLLPATVSD